MPNQRYLGALVDPNSGHLHPLKYTQGLARAALGLGVRILEQSKVTQLVRDLRDVSTSLKSVTEKVDQGGISSVVGGTALPEYKPGSRNQK